jgi:hypothetical protein
MATINYFFLAELFSESFKPARHVRPISRAPRISLSSDIVADMSEILQWIGALVLAKFAFNLAYSLASSFYAFYVHAANPKKYGKWAVVTGATDGIGKAYATAVSALRNTSPDLEAGQQGCERCDHQPHGRKARSCCQ